MVEWEEVAQMEGEAEEMEEGRGRVGLGLAGLVRVKEAREREGLRTKRGMGNKGGTE